MSLRIPRILACNSFYYYENLERAGAFYQEILGFETVVDYGSAKILRVAQSSYLTLVDATLCKHQIGEPKSVTLALVTNQVEAWYAYLKQAGVSIHKHYEINEGRPHDGFVVLDPEGYYLEFERFNPHPENDALIPMLSKIEPLYPITGSRPIDLGIQATVLWLYYRNLGNIQQFYEKLLDVELLVDQGWAKVYQVVGSGFIGFVDGKHGLHQASKKKGVTVSFFTDDVDRWLERTSAFDGFKLCTQQITDLSGQVERFASNDLEGYILEWDTFLDTQENKVLLRLLNKE